MKKPVIDISECVLCDICVELCPDVFIKNQVGYIEVAENFTDSIDQPWDNIEDDINDVIKSCRGDCISWVKQNEKA